MTDTPEGQKPEVETPKTYDEGYIKELRSEAAGYRVERNELRKQVEDLATEVKGFKDGNKSEIEKLTEGKAKAESALLDKEREIGEMMTRSRVMSTAAGLNIVDPEAAYKLVDLSVIDPEDSKSVKKALEELVKAKPYLVKAPPAPGMGGSSIKGGKQSVEDQWVALMKSGLKK